MTRRLESKEPYQRILISTVGLPCSGKSHWAKEFAGPVGIPVINADSIRWSLHGNVFIPEAERVVWSVARTMVYHFFHYGYMTVLLDETSINRWARDQWRSEHWVNVYKYIDTPLDVCIERLREKISKLTKDLSWAESNAIYDDYVSAIHRMNKSFEPLSDDEIKFEDFSGTGFWVSRIL